MEKVEFKHMNKIILTGPIVRKTGNEIACNLTIKTPRLNMPNVITGEQPAYNYPEMAFYGTTRKEAEKYKVGDVVSIIGTISPQRKLSKDTGRDYYDQKLIGLNINTAERLLMREFGYDDGPFIESENKVLLGGVISSIMSPANGIVNINIRTFVDGRIHNIHTVLYTRNVDSYLERFKVNDNVFAIGTLQTQGKTVDEGRKRFFRNVVLRAICKAE